MTAFLKLPKGQLSAMVEAQRREELKKKLTDPPAPLFKEVRELIIRKCQPAKRMELREIFKKQAFGEFERLVTQTLLDVTQGIAREELESENWPRNYSKLRRRVAHEEMRAITFGLSGYGCFLDVSIDHCAVFLEPMIDSWDIDLKTFGMEIELNKGMAETEFLKFQFTETGGTPSSEVEPGLQPLATRRPAAMPPAKNWNS